MNLLEILVYWINELDEAGRMTAKFSTILVLVWFMTVSSTVSAQAQAVSVDVSYGIRAGGGVMVMRDGQWVPEESAEISGSITLKVSLDGDVTEHSATVVDSTEIDGKVVYQCDNGESFYVVGDAAYPVIAENFESGSQNLEQSIESYRESRSDTLAWRIWRLLGQ